MAMKILPGNGGGTSKPAVFQILYKYVSHELVERPRAGFWTPIGQWVRVPLRSWAEDLLKPSLLHSQAFPLPDQIQRRRQHLSGWFDHTTRLLNVLMWQFWLEEWG